MLNASGMIRFIGNLCILLNDARHFKATTLMSKLYQLILDSWV